MRGNQDGVGPPSPTRRRVAVGLMVLGVGLALPCWIITAVSVRNSLKVRADSAVPGSFEVSLPRGEWEVYQLTGTVSGSSLGPLSYSRQIDQPVTIDAADIRVTGPDALTVATRNRFGPTSFQTYRTRSKIYTGVASFVLSRSGAYRIDVVAPQPATVIVAGPPFAGFASVIGWIVAGAVGGVAFIVGLVLLILDFDRRRRATAPLSVAGAGPGGWAPLQPPQPPVRPPWGGDHAAAPSSGSTTPAAGGARPGWHPDPSGRHQFRYWDGHSWTGHVSTAGVAGTDPL